MRVFVTGGTGFIGSAIVPELLGAGHEVVGLARSEQGAAALHAAGAEVHRGELTDLDALRSGAATADGVIHTAFIHDFSQMNDAGTIDLRAVETLGAALQASGGPLVIASGTALLTPGRVGTEDDLPNSSGPGRHRQGSEAAIRELAGRGVRSSIIRLAPSVHGEGDHGFVPVLIEIARTKGVSAYIGDGSNRWPAVHRLDAARLFRLALEHGQAGSAYHGADDEGIETRAIAEAIGRHLDVPVVAISPDEADEHFGWMARFFGVDVPASSALTRERLGWNPTHPGLIEDLDAGHYFAQVGEAAAWL